MDYASWVKPRLKHVMWRLYAVDGLADMFEKCFLNTLETTATETEAGESFVITGDIPAMWLRDSTEQVLHYIRFAKDEPKLAAWIERLIARQTEDVLYDPYANAFNREENGRHGYNDTPAPGKRVWERKYEVDSLCHMIYLAWRYYEATGSTRFMTDEFYAALERIRHVFSVEQYHFERSHYTFERTDCPPSDTLTNGGMGDPVGYTGMTWSGFRPSDDACRYGYLIPANLFAAAMMEKAALMCRLDGRDTLADRMEKQGGQMRQGVMEFGTVEHPKFGRIYAYETDGLGHCNLMDDANVPSLLALPYLGLCDLHDEIYQNTRRFVLSSENPCFYEGRLARGVGSPHTPRGYVWPIALCIQAMTTDDVAEQAELLRMLLRTDARTGFMHESFHPDDATRFTREWFAWANSMFGEMLYRFYEAGTLEEIVARVKADGAE